jgi:hypothetical protein
MRLYLLKTAVAGMGFSQVRAVNSARLAFIPPVTF